MLGWRTSRARSVSEHDGPIHVAGGGRQLLPPARRCWAARTRRSPSCSPTSATSPPSRRRGAPGDGVDAQRVLRAHGGRGLQPRGVSDSYRRRRHGACSALPFNGEHDADDAVNRGNTMFVALGVLNRARRQAGKPPLTSAGIATGWWSWATSAPPGAWSTRHRRLGHLASRLRAPPSSTAQDLIARHPGRLRQPTLLRRDRPAPRAGQARAGGDLRGDGPA